MLFSYITVPLKAWGASKSFLTRLSAAQLDYLQHFAAVRLGSPLHDAVVGLINSPLHDAAERFDSLQQVVKSFRCIMLRGYFCKNQ
jgi:hypothetical protein